MVRANKKVLLTKEAILDRISEYDIIRAFWPSNRKLKLNTDILSPFRNEDDPSFIIGTKYGHITYKDMGDYQYRGDVWDFVQQIEHLADLNSILIAVDQKFELGLSTGNPIKSGTSSIITWEQPKIELRPPPKIDVITRPYNNNELEWWNMYFQDKEDLKREEIYVPRFIYRNKTRIPVPKDDLIFCYYYREVDKWKIYRPLRASKSKEKLPAYMRKWDTDLPFNYVENLKSINGCNFAYLEKSKKDKMVLRKALETDCIAITSAEDPSCLTDETLLHIKNNSLIQVIVSDNDKKGKEFSWWLTNNHGYRHCNVPDPLKEAGITDFADWARESKTLQVVRDHFKLKNLI